MAPEATVEGGSGRVVLAARGLGKRYGAAEALVDLSFELRAGQILGLLGPNAAGKTTAIRILTTILPPSRGRFEVLGVPDSNPTAIKELIGVLPESNGFPGHMTGREFLTYMARLYRRPPRDAEQKADELLDLFGLAEARGKTIHAYSRGMRQRLAMARAMINEPRVLFLDEPTLGFDPKGQAEMLRVIRDTAAVHEVGVVLSSHQLEVVEAVCDRVLILDHGTVVAAGTVSEIAGHAPTTGRFRVSVPTCLVKTAMLTLAALPGIHAIAPTGGGNEIAVTVTAGPGPGAADWSEPGSAAAPPAAHAADLGGNRVLSSLIAAGVPVEEFAREGTRLNEIFLELTSGEAP